MKGQNTYSIFIDDNYVDPASVNLSFPDKSYLYFFGINGDNICR